MENFRQIFPIIGKLSAALLLVPGLAAWAAREPPPDSATVPDFHNPARVIKYAPASEFVRLRGRDVNPLARRDRAGRAVDLSAAQVAPADNLRLIQLNGPLDAAAAEELRAAGARIVGFIPDNTLIAEVPAARETAARGLARVRWLGNYAPFYRLTGRLARAAQQTPLVSVRAFLAEGFDAAAALAAAQALGDATLRQQDGAVIEAVVPAARLEELCAIPGVVIVDYAPQPQLMNHVAAGILQTRPLWTNWRYYGSNETVAVADSGLDVCSNSYAAVHADFRDGNDNPRVVFLQDLSGDGAHDPVSGHGTHVAGSVLGNGKLSGADPATHAYPTNCYAGMAPEAKLVFQAIGRTTNSDAVYPPANLNDLFRAAYTNGARIHQNSWGANSYGAYTANARQLDEYVFFNPEMLVCFSAGNKGIDANGDGVVDLGSVGSPGTSKNGLTVGASETERPSMSGLYGENFPAEPIASDPMANNTNGMAAFSSRGPCADGRIKPDVVAPGTYIGSARTHAAPAVSNLLWGTISGNTNYCWSVGTSMSTPLVSGLAALLREYLRKDRGLTNPPAALLKALLIHSAVDMSPGQYGTGATREMTNAPNNVEGWGRPALENLIRQNGGYALRYVDGWTAPFTNESSMVTNVVVYNTNLPLRVHLTWTDFYGSSQTFNTNYDDTTGGGIINDLDLWCVSPAGFTNRPAVRDTRVGLYYYTNNSFTWSSGTNFYAQRMCAPELPLTLACMQASVRDTNASGGNIAFYIWAATATGGPPRNVLFVTTNTVAVGGTNWTLSIPMNVVITTKYFYAGARQLTGSTIRQTRDVGTSQWAFVSANGTSWSSIGTSGDLWIHAFGRAPSNDHVNTVEGVVINQPATGTWQIVVNAACVPRGPCRYAVAFSGGLAPLSNSPPAAPVLHSPTNCPDAGNDGLVANDDIARYGRTLNPQPPLVWYIPADADGDLLHFKVFADTTNAATLLANSSNTVSGFAYYDGGSWKDFPAGGVPGTSAVAKVRYKPAVAWLANTGHFWRVLATDAAASSPSSRTNRFVLGARTWTDPNPVPGVTLIRKVQLDEIREEANYARVSRRYSSNAWEAIVAGQTAVRATYFTNLYGVIAEVTNLTGETIAPYPAITPGVTPVSTNYLHQLRRAIEGI